MRTTVLLDMLQKGARRFRRAEGGNVVMTFTLSMIPVIAFIGAAVDYSRGNSAKAALQSTNDAMALMLSKDVSNLATGQIAEKATDYFKALLNRPEITDLSIVPSYSSPQAGSFKLVVDATAKVPTVFMNMFGHSTMDLSVTSEVVWGIKRLELALALDNTGSMGWSNKMTELKKALLAVSGQNGATADGLLETLKKAAKQPGDVKIAIIPFDTTVKIGTSYKDEDWIDWTEAYGSCSKSQYKTKTACQANSGTWTANNNKNTWGGCVIDRDQSNDVLDTTPDGSKATKFPATSQCGSGLAAALPLTDIWGGGYTTLKDKINAMQPNGYTNVTIGLAWGWHALTASLPFPEASVPKPDIDKVIILLTDGDNTQNRWTTSQSSIDARTQAACTNAKAANIKLYTIRVIEGNTTLLKGCATNPSMYYDVQQAAQLNPVFAAIAQKLANLRIAK